MRFKDIAQFTPDGYYNVDQSWDGIEDWIKRQNNLNLNPDFQRGHVWTEDQQIAYVEFCLQGGKGSSDLRFNCVGWMNDFRGPFVLVDGKQRLEAARKFLRNELQVFGHTFSEFEGRFPIVDFSMRVNDLKSRADVLRWYLEINHGGVAHTEKELDKVRGMLANEG